MLDSTVDRRAPRAVADAPVADGAVIAKAWLVALVEAAPLRAAATLPVSSLAAEGPALCAAMLEALGSDAALERLRAGGDRAGLAARAGQLAGAHDPAGAVAALEALRAAAWDALACDDVQLAIRLLIPAGSRLLDLQEIRDAVGRFDPLALAYPWQHHDARVDVLQQTVSALAARNVTRNDTFDAIRAAAADAAGVPLPAAGPRLNGERPRVPFLSEPWYCCAEPTEGQAALL